MSVKVDRAKTANIIRENICKCGGSLTSKYAPFPNDIIICRKCGEDCEGWVSKQRLEQQQYESELDRREVVKAFPELEDEMKGKRIKTLRGNKLAFPELGQIRKGMKEEREKDGRKYTVPVDLDYFRVVFLEGEEAAAQNFKAVYGETPREINIRFPFNDINKLWSTSLVGFLAGGLVAESDGEIYTYLRDGITGEEIVKNGRRVDTGDVMPFEKDIPATHYEKVTKFKSGPRRGEVKEKKQVPVFCDPSGLLRVMVAELGRAAFMTVVTNSWNDIEALDAYLEGLYAITGGDIQGLPVILKRRPSMVSTPGQDGKRVRREKWLLHLEVDPAYAKHRFAELERQIFEAPALEGEVEEVPALPAVVEGEFDHGRYVDHNTGEVLEGEVVEDEPEDDGLDPFEKAMESAKLLQNYRAIAMLFVEKLNIIRDAVFYRFAERMGIDKEKEKDLLMGILRDAKGDGKFVQAVEALLNHIGFLEAQNNG